METKEQKTMNESQVTDVTLEEESQQENPTVQVRIDVTSEPKAKPTERERLEARMRSAKPQRLWNDDESFFKAINDDYDEQEILQELYDEQASEHERTLEAAVAAAAHEGELRGRNLKIEEELRRIRQPEHIHNLDGSPRGASNSRQERPELGALNRVGYQSIWERGREVRIKN